MQNRVSAFRFRIKRKQEFETLKEQVTELCNENDRLQNEVRYTETLEISFFPNQIWSKNIIDASQN